MSVPLLGRMTRLHAVIAQMAGEEVHAIRHDQFQCVSWVSRSARVARFMRDWFAGYDAGALL